MLPTNGFQSQQTKIICSTLLLGVGLVYAVKKWLDSRSQKPSGKWRKAGVVTELKLYPIKSGSPVSLEIGNVTSIGLEDVPLPGRMSLGDRRLVVYKHPEMEMVSARTHPHMLRIQVEAVSERHVTLKYRDQWIRVELRQCEPDRKIQLWTEQVPLSDCGDEVAAWLQRVVYNGKDGYRMGYYSDPNVRRNIPHLVEKYKEYYPFMRDEFTGAFSDLSPFLLLNESSVADLNKRIKERSESLPSRNDSDKHEPATVTCTNFRGNIIVKGPKPYEEDEWKWVKIGNMLVFRNFKPCTRCSLTTVDPETCKKDENMEPLTTLRTYRLLDENRRLLDKSPAMGIYLGLWEHSGSIKVGDFVYVCE